ncbi:MAG: CotH kinase family protein, partial [Vicinamibacterales bacterium]
MRRSSLAVLCLVVVAQLSSAARASRPPGWSDDTHGRDAIPDYARVFPADRVSRLDIAMTAMDWATVIADMTDMAGPFGAQRTPAANGGFGGFPQPSPEATAACIGRVVGDACAFGATTGGRCIQQTNGGTLACVAIGGGNPGGGLPGGGNPGGGFPGGGGAGNGRAQGADDVDIFPRTPVYVPADVAFDGETFHDVGFRLKGNSSLSNAWRAGADKLPFRLNFDVLDDRYPGIQDQTFFGFPNLAFTNNGTDTSFLRHRVVTELFREAGVPAAHTAFVRVYMNRGDGPVYLGLYTMTEVPDTPMLDTLFGSNDGNLYKPVGTGGRWTTFFQLSFPKKTNADDEDWTDIEEAIATLNASRADRTVWRARLEARFEVNGFLRWLALNTIVGNNDAYGGLSAHNYYLYGSPRHRDRLFWIAWDHDLAM